MLTGERTARREHQRDVPDNDGSKPFFFSMGDRHLQATNRKRATWKQILNKSKDFTGDLHQQFADLKEWLESDWRGNAKRAVPTADPTTAAAEHAPARSKPALGQPHAKKLRLRRKCTQLQPRSTAPVAVPRDPHAAPPTVHRSTCRRVISARPRCAEVHGGARATPDTADATMNRRLKKTETASKQNSRAAGKEESSSG